MNGDRCSARPQGAHNAYRCPTLSTVERDGKPYCKLHDPERRWPDRIKLPPKERGE